MGPLSQQVPGLSVGLFCIMFGMLWLDMALQKAPWVLNAEGRRFGWLSNWIWTEMQPPTFGFYKAFLEHVVWLRAQPGILQLFRAPEATAGLGLRSNGLEGCDHGVHVEQGAVCIKHRRLGCDHRCSLGSRCMPRCRSASHASSRLTLWLRSRWRQWHAPTRPDRRSAGPRPHDTPRAHRRQ